MSKITIDFNDIVRPIRPMHGLGAGPVNNNFSTDTSDYYREAGIPYARMHDIEYPFGSGEFVDIHCIFRDFDADADDPKSYNFIFTDEYFKAVEATGCKVFYRLGETIEHQPIKRYIYPPKDYLKWAKICEHIIMHYTKGWADGFNMDIKYWEIWNEPDGDGNCWIGTEEEFFELYTVAATYLKEKLPEIKIGGCAFCGDRPMSERFLKYISERNAPLDFFSWHDYASDPMIFEKRFNDFDARLKKYGYPDAENICDEWNYVIDWKERLPESKYHHKTNVGAAFNAAVMTVFQKNTALSLSTYYYGGPGTWCGLFSPGTNNNHGGMIKAVVEKPYYVHKTFGDMYRLGNEVKSISDRDDLYVLAATGEGGKVAMICRFDDCSLNGKATVPEKISIDLGTDGEFEYYLIDDEHFYDKIEATPTIELKNYSVLCIKSK